MSDIREHVPTDEVTRLLHIARAAAVRSYEVHAYLPKTSKEAESFIPHSWVLDALKYAYTAGKQDGAEAAQAAMRSAMGAAKW